jgi:hypothetical protein
VADLTAENVELRTACSTGWGEPQLIKTLTAERDALRRALHDIAEEWAGAETGEPVYAQEAYALGLAKRMYALAIDAARGQA